MGRYTRALAVSTRDRWLAAGLVALVVAAYLPVLSAGYVWDDDRHVTANAVLTAPHGLAAAWITLDATPQYYPLTHTVFWLEHALWGFAPAGYHLVNVLLHALSAVLLFRILVLLEIPGAFLAAAIFGVHPVHVESVAWVSELKNALSGVLYLGASRLFLGWALGRERGDARPLFAALLFACALLSKTVTASWPVAMAIVLWWKTGTVERRAALWLAPLLALGALFGGITHHLERTQVGASGAEWELSLLGRLALSGRIVWFYLAKLVWPYPLIFIYPRWTIDATSILAWIWIVGVGAAFVLCRRLSRGAFAALAFFVVTLAPALGFFDVYPMRYAFVADHFQYLASIAPIVLFAAFLAKRRWTLQAAAALVVALASLTAVRATAYRDEETLWRDTIARNPSAWIAHNNLGILLAEKGRNDEAAAAFARVLALKPDHAGARANLGYLQELQGKPAEAAATLTLAAPDRPGDADLRVHLVRDLIATGRFDEAVAPAVEAARLRPDDPDILCDAGTLLARAGRTAEAIPLLERAVKLRPGFARAQANLDLARRVGYPRDPR
ncbi:MAG TPA: tetratricopeptide repeat protein [Candidatus Polarisedimenticolaceae bacterium]|nr:tetratricopeptide repeat protein [Candidatus Polarisedimenticolaceae bacterium]